MGKQFILFMTAWAVTVLSFNLCFVGFWAALAITAGVLIVPWEPIAFVIVIKTINFLRQKKLAHDWLHHPLMAFIQVKGEFKVKILTKAHKYVIKHKKR